MKRTKIVCTIGPACESVEKIKQLAEAGMNVARLNFSHGSYASHAHLIKNIRQVAKARREPIAIMQDLQGPRIRLGKLPPDGIAIKRGDKVVLVPEEKVASFKSAKGAIVLPTQIALQKIVKSGETVLIKDGLVRLKAEKVNSEAVWATVEEGDTLTSNRGINLPESTLPDVVLTAKDRQDVKYGIKQQVDWIALSFVRHANDIKILRKMFPRWGAYRPRIVAKIERPEAVQNFAEILQEADGIMVARGDLGIELPAQDIPLIQKQLIRDALLAAKPVIVATQMLESMITNPRATRAEVSDVANAVIDQADALMLSGETAFGKYPIEACRTMAEVIIKTEGSKFDIVPLHETNSTAAPELLAHTISEVSKLDQIKAIIVMSSSGRSAQLVAGERPAAPILALTQNELTRRQLAMVWGVQPDLLKRFDNIDDLFAAAIKLAKKVLKIQRGDKIIIASGHPTGPHGHLNLLKIHTI
ncbi:MAG: pyruvate kinase [Patescibacteria group bacterium]